MEMSFADAKSTVDRITGVENVGRSSNSARRTDAQSKQSATRTNAKSTLTHSS